MSKTLSEFISQVKFFIEEDGLSIDEAITRVKVPDEYADKIKADIIKLINFKPENTSIISSGTSLLCINPDTIYETDIFGSFLNHIYDNMGWGQDVCKSIKKSTDQIIINIPDPVKSNRFSHRGLVVGHVQSGKTANMAGLIARCIDAGYKVVIVLAGILNNLRSQTQHRLDKDIIGRGKAGECIGHAVEIRRHTSELLNGDFQGSTDRLDREKPNIFIIKKHPKVIEKLESWLTDEMNNHNLNDFPCVIIDDEADQASINTNYDKYDDGERVDPTVTNKKIRDIISLFPKCTYVGYTATPYANILIDANEQDLYPKDFIAVLPEPIDYLGARKIFGLGMSPSYLSEENNEDPLLDVVRDVPEDDLNLIENLHEISDCPQSLRNAVISFLLSSACQYLRGKVNDHYSMLVHISYRIINHQIVSELIINEVEFLKKVVNDKFNTYPETLQLMKGIWETDFLLTTKNIKGNVTNYSFEEIKSAILKFIDQIEVLSLYSGSSHNLNYNGEAKRYIVIGGNKLSRGLTLEGLSVSFFTRTARTYDTLFQMGRWFGYRNGYEDLTRLFVSEENYNNFKDLARVEAELREDLKKYAEKERKITPLDIFPVIRSHPTLAVTSQSKMGAGRKINISYSGSTSETVNFYFNDKEKLLNNQLVVSNFLKQIGIPIKKNNEGMYFWADIQVDFILDLLKVYNFSPDARTVNSTMLTEYISKQNKNYKELIKWDIIIPRGNKKCGEYNWYNGINSYKISRSRFNNSSIKVLRDPIDIEKWKEELERDEDDCERGALFLYTIDKNSYQNLPRKQLFKTNEANEDIIGIVLKFPLSRSFETVEYISQGYRNASL